MQHAPVVEGDPRQCRELFNQSAYEFQHSLADHPLFALDRLVDVARRVQERKTPHGSVADAFVSEGEREAGERAGWHETNTSTITEMVDRIAEKQAWIILKHVQREPGYREVMEDCICDLLSLSRREVVHQVKWFEAILFITSPRRISNYHIDRECSWLLQIGGRKEIHLFDRNDHDVLPELEVERFWGQYGFPGIYKPELEHRAQVYSLRPGNGVHIPVNWPHWIQNGDEVSISLNVNFQFRDAVVGDAHRANYYLRRLGLSPAAPGRSAWRDALKSAAIGGVRGIKKLRQKRSEVEREDLRQRQRIVERLGNPAR